MNRRSVLVATTLAAALVLTACGSGGSTAPAAPGAPAAPAGGPLDLKAAGCPATVVLQQDWQPEAEHGAMYSVVGPGYTIDSDKKSVTGPLVAQGVDTGVKVEVRAGGPNTGFKPVPALMYVDPSITLGAVNTDQAIVSAAAQQVTVAVTSQLTVSPQILMWDPATYPGMTTLKQVAATGAPVVTSGEVLPALLASQGIITKAQSDTSYDGTPARFVSDPKIMQQGFATAEPYIYENEIAQWHKPIASETFSNYGYSIYPEPLAVRADKLDGLRSCLQKLVPVMQRAQVDYLKTPGPTNALIVKLVDSYQTGWSYTAGDADFSAKTQLSGGFVENDPASGVFGQFDPARMQDTVARFVPILQAAGTLTGPAPAATSLFTNDFIDKSVKLS
ncbi:ABC transporter substrate-binding protein [Pseudonocardia sp. GCM10023141]|uniref:ABC transporter substrate-binding protein n=1 Tax=Pseudonocardia sp. GCM10023141 TaxID=3252653 RepID=UPI0036228C19